MGRRSSGGTSTYVAETRFIRIHFTATAQRKLSEQRCCRNVVEDKAKTMMKKKNSSIMPQLEPVSRPLLYDRMSAAAAANRVIAHELGLST